MKKAFILLLFIAIAFCGYEYVINKNESAVEEKVELITPELDVERGIIYKYDVQNISSKCGDSEIVCAIDLVARCTIDFKLSECNKEKMPKFIFMEDESLERPTELSFEISKIKNIDKNTIEVYTKSDCNGMWFGLCKGNIIYVLNKKDGKMIVKNIYAREEL